MPLQPGAKIGAYEIIAAVETADSAALYRASDPQLNREVAIRVFTGPLSERCEQESLAIAALHHPHICALYDIGHEDGMSYQVVECLEGQTLAARLEGGRALDLDQAVTTAIQIADALDKAHLAGVAHRDLKPSKILLTPAGAKVLDFGLSEPKLPDGEATSPKGLPAADIDGELHYTAPECLEGKEGDWRSDIFALGTILYEMVTGKKAFDGPNRAVMIALITTTEPVPLSKARPGAPPLLQHVIKRCLAKDPEERWQTAHDLLLQLRWMTEGGKLAAASPAATMGTRMRVFLAAAALLILAMAVPAAMYLRGSGSSGRFEFRVPVRGLNTADIALSP